MEKNPETESLDDLFKFGFKAIKDLEDMEPTDAKYSQIVAEAVSKLEQCTTFVSGFYITRITISNAECDPNRAQGSAVRAPLTFDSLDFPGESIEPIQRQ